MKQKVIIIPVILSMCLHLIADISHAQPFRPASQAGGFYSNLPDSAIELINKALPRTAAVTPVKPRKLLVFNLDIWDGEIRAGHPSIPYANYMLQLMGRRTGAYETFFSKDTMVFKSEYLNQFDAICFNNTVGVLFEDPGLRNNLLEYVYSGKGFSASTLPGPLSASGRSMTSSPSMARCWALMRTAGIPGSRTNGSP